LSERKDTPRREPVGFAPHLVPPKGIAPEERIRRSREMLCRVLSLETTVAFVGAGCSAPLGYPTWGALSTLLTHQTRELLDTPAVATQLSSLARSDLDRCKTLVDGLRTSRPEEKMFAFSVCRKILSDGAYRRFLEYQFWRRPRPKTGPESSSPLDSLLGLPLYRFVTTNYDHEIERALARVRFIPEEEFGLPPKPGQPPDRPHPARPRSFTQKPENCDRLALFALAEVEEARNLVFHCHGRIDDFDSIVATEEDYQHWYLEDGNPGKRVFLQALDLLLGSNPILFVGYGLGDEDLLRPLRLLHATYPEDRFSRPLFALIRENQPGEDRDHHEFYFERYGLNVLPFTATEKEAERGLCNALAGLVQELSSWRRSWIEKPRFRQVTFETHPPKPYRHPGPIPDLGEPSGAGQQDAQDPLLRYSELESLHQLVAGRGKDRDGSEPPHVVVLLGESGTGKSWLALQLIEDLSKLPDPEATFQGLFFWSSYYSDDLLSCVESLLHYLDSSDATADIGPRLDRFQALLYQGEDLPKRYLIVIDGFDRLLCRTGRTDEGRIENHAARKFFELFLSPKCRSTLLITSQLWPRELDDPPYVCRFPIQRLQFTKTVLNIFDTEEADTRALFGLLQGHAYALLLASQFLKRRPPGEPPPLKRLEEALFGLTPDRRLWQLIREVVTEVDRETHGQALPLLELLAVFMTPVTASIRAVCYKEVLKALAEERPVFPEHTLPEHTLPDVEEVTEKLVESLLLSKDFCGSSDCKERIPIWTVPATVRRYVFEQVHQSTRDALPHFTLSGFTSGDAAVDPGAARGAKRVKRLWERLHEETEEAIQSHKRATTELCRERELRRSRELCRALFSVMRARMESNTTPRWWTYKEYARLCVRLIDLVRCVSHLAASECQDFLFWTYCEPHAIQAIESKLAPLHADELAWLYNEAGLTFLACGHMADCLQVWEQGYEINRVIDGTRPVPLYTLQSQLHLAHATLDLGRLREMQHYLDEAERTNAQVGDADACGRILGFRALLAHLQSDLDMADRLYRKALKELRASGNSRAGSYFQSHRAALKTCLGHLDKADEAVGSALALAETAGYPDLVVYARLAGAQVCRARGRLVDATVALNAALGEAKRLQLGRLQAEILTELARLALDLGDGALARQRATEALEISNSHSLGLRRSHSLLVLGLAMLKSEQRKLGIAYLQQAQRIATSQEYWLCRREAREVLESLGESERPEEEPLSV